MFFGIREILYSIGVIKELAQGFHEPSLEVSEKRELSSGVYSIESSSASVIVLLYRQYLRGSYTATGDQRNKISLIMIDLF